LGSTVCVRQSYGEAGTTSEANIDQAFLKHLVRAWVVKGKPDLLHCVKKFTDYREAGLVKEHTCLAEDFIFGIKQKLFKGKTKEKLGDQTS
jgi:hypothetical protein